MSAANGSLADGAQPGRFGASGLCGPSTLKACLTGETGPPSSNGLKFKIKRTSTEDGRPSNNHVATPINNTTTTNFPSVSSPSQNQDPKNPKPAKKKVLDPLPIKSGSDSGVSTGSNSLSSSAGSSPMSPALAAANSPDSRNPVTGKRSEPFQIRGGAMADNTSSPSKKLKTSHGDSVTMPRVSNGLEKDIGTMTDPESLGPCEPGTAVKLQGIVWQETDKGLLVLNVTWKGKTFMGTLLDCQRQLEAHKWGPPRDALSARGRTRRGGRNSRSRTPPVKIQFRKGLPNSKGNQNPHNIFSSTPASPSARGRPLQPVLFDEMDEVDDEVRNEVKTETIIVPQPANSLSPNSRLIECPKSECSKKYRDLDALKYHLSFAHNDLKKAPTETKEEPDSNVNGETKESNDEVSNNMNDVKPITATEKKLSSEKSDQETKPSIATDPLSKENIIEKPKNLTNGDHVKDEMTKTQIKEEPVPKPTDLSTSSSSSSSSSQVKTEAETQVKSEVPIKREIQVQNGHSAPTSSIFNPMNMNLGHAHQQPPTMANKIRVPTVQTMNGSNNYPNHITSHSQLPQLNHLQQQQQIQNQIQNQIKQIQNQHPSGSIHNPRTVSPAYSDISDEEPETPAPLGLTTKPVDPKQSLLNVRRDKPATSDPSRAPLDLTQPSFSGFPPMRPPLQQFGLGSPLGARFAPPGLPTSTPTLNMLHSLMASASKFQEIQQALGVGMGSLQGPRPSPPPPSGQNIPKSGPYTKSSVPLPPPPPLRHEHNHTHLHLGPGYPTSTLTQSVTSSTSMATKMAMAAEAAKRSMTPVTSGSLHLPPHLSPFVTGSFGLGPPRLASPFPPKP